MTKSGDLHPSKDEDSAGKLDYAPLVRRAAAGESGALEQLLMRAQEVAFRFSLLVCGHADDAEDVMQDALLKTYQHVRRILDGVKLTPFFELAEDESAASEAAWSAYLARGASDPRDLSAREALACVGSDDPARQRAFDAHVDALCRDMDDGKAIETTPAELMARVRARLGVPPR